jgi:VIT1/CCC1 family predicted Fe2+/Mn2+ transporter
MSRSGVLLLIGVLLVITPFAGLPSGWVTGIVSFLGLLVCVVGLSLREMHIKKAMRGAQSEEVELAPTEPAHVSHHGVSRI